ncbi:MAG: ABC transporter ATP-binding protein [Ruminiclostridium sp.]|nr:ABC transporter ATP-binding protein [Ruminiclostridium sp.]
MNENILEIKSLDGWYKKGNNILSELSFDLYKNEIVGLIGLNGAGKTTLIKILSGLLEGYKADNVCFDGKAVNFRDGRFKNQRYTVFSEDSSFGYFTFREYISYVFSAYSKKLGDVSELVRGFHFEEFENKLLKDLSMGNRRKVNLITAFALKAPLLLLDEPVNGLDFQSTEFLYSLISGYKEHGTLLFSSHILESITLTSDRVMVLENGRISRTFTGGEITAESVRKVLKLDNVI